MASKASLKRAEDLVDFLNASPTPFHAVRSAEQRLDKAGFTKIKERDNWTPSLTPGGKYYLTRNGSTIVAFAIGQAWKPGNPVAMVAAHTDSPCLRIKPVSKRSADGFLQVGVETYGSGMWHTWFDRDLGAAGIVMVKTRDGGMEQKLVRISRPICKIPNLAVHFGDFSGSVPFEFNQETHLFPITGLVSAELNRTGKTAEESSKETKEAETGFNPLKIPTQRHHPYLIELLASEAGCKPDEILDFELVLFDTQPACIGGLNNEFIFSARLDNLCMSYCAVEGIISSLSSSAADDSIIRLIACFDHEEIGCKSSQGAGSNLLPSVIRRLSCLPSAASSSSDSEESYIDNATAYEQTLSMSLIVSADMGHSVNPNYSAKYESNHSPRMNEGTNIKINANVNYATDSPGLVLLQECARRARGTSYQPPGTKAAQGGVPLQLEVVRNDMPCGSTLGPTLSASLGVRTIDVGNAQLAMHSIRETAGCYDVEFGVNLLESFFEHYGELEGKMVVD